MEYGDVIVYFTIAALGTSILVIIGLLWFLVKKSGEPPTG